MLPVTPPLFLFAYSVGIHIRRSFVHIAASPDVLLARNATRPHPVPAASLLKIAGSLEAPLASKNYFETPVLTLQYDDAVATNARIVASWLGGCWQVVSLHSPYFHTP